MTPTMFEDLVTVQVEALRCGDFRALEEASTRKRLAWLEEQGHTDSRRRWSPRESFELLFAEYMGLSLDELPIVFESDDGIVWRSMNRCPTLEACARLGFDTRHVCRVAFETPVQAFLDALDSRLRFDRSYETIRPHAPYCEERIVRVGSKAQ